MRALAIAIVLASVAVASADVRITDNTAYTTPTGKVRAGLWKLQCGIPYADGLELGTYTLPYATWAVDVRSFNGHAKYRLLDRGRWTLSASLGVAYVDFANLDVPVDVWVVPTSLLGAARLGDRITFGAGAMYTHMVGEGRYNPDEDSTFRGAVALSNVQGWLSLTTRISRGWSLYLEGRTISSTEASGAGDVMYTIDERTHVDVAATGKASVDELRGGALLAALQYSRTSFRMRFGLGYGNFNVPMLNFVVPVATPFPELDLFWVF